MEQLDVHLKKLMESYKITPESINKFLSYNNITKEDIKIIKDIGSKIGDIPDELISNFYQHIFKFPETKKIIENKQDKIEQLKEHHKNYLKQIFEGNFDDVNYMLSRLAIGYIHAKEAIPSSYYIGAYGKYIDELYKFLKDYIPEENLYKFSNALFKVLLFDLSFALESYFFKKQESIEEINKKYRKILDSSNDAILIIDSKTFRIVDYNKKLKETVGLTEDELSGLNAVKITPKVLWKKYIKEIEKIKNEKNHFFPHILIENKKTKKIIPCEINASTFEFEGNKYIVAIFRDITTRKTLEGEIERLNRLYSVLSKINLAIVRHNSIEEIFTEAVKIIVEYGKFKTACISEVNLKEKKIIPKYIYGDDSYFKDIKFPLSEKTHIENISFLENDVIVIKDVNKLPDECQWKDRVKRMGFNSAIVTPIYKKTEPKSKNIRWILSIYSDEIKSFEEKEISLVKEISFDLSFAVENLREKLKFKYFSEFDKVTDLPNRKSFIEKLNSIANFKDEKFAVIFLDIDKFKAINDTFGYLTGDLLLKKITQKLKKLTTAKDFLAKVGSDEFGIILFDISNKEDLLNFIKNIEKEFSNPIKVNDEEILVSFSIGISIFPDDGKTTEDIISRTEIALTKAKEFEDSFYFYSEKLNEKTHEILNLEKDLRLAIKNDEFEVYYQPKIDIERNKIVGAEALLRWLKKNGEIVPPFKFIPLLEESGLINKVGLIVLEKVCNQIKEWQKENIYIDVAVNISSVQLKTEKFLK